MAFWGHRVRSWPARLRLLRASEVGFSPWPVLIMEAVWNAIGVLDGLLRDVPNYPIRILDEPTASTGYTWQIQDNNSQLMLRTPIKRSRSVCQKHALLVGGPDSCSVAASADPCSAPAILLLSCSKGPLPNVDETMLPHEA